MMSLPRLALHRRTVLLSFVTLAFLLGLYQFATMPRRADPEFTIRTCTVTTIWPGVQAERVERLVTFPLEEQISSLADVDYVKSTTTTGQSVIYVYLPDELPIAKIQETWERVRGRVELVRPSLPAGVRDPVVNDDFGDTAILLLAVHEREPDPAGPRYEPRELETIAKRVRERISLMPGVAKAELHGNRSEAIYLECDPDRWGNIDLTLDQLAAFLEARNISSSGGSVETQTSRLGIEPSGEFSSVDQIRSVVVGRAPTGTPIDLDDLGFSVRRDYQDPPSVIVRRGDLRSDSPAIICSVIMQDGQKVTELGPRVLRVVDAMQSIERTVPDDIAVTVAYDESRFVDDKVSDFVINVIQAIVIVIAVAMVMAGLRSAVVMAAAIPFVMVISIGIAAVFGIQLEQMSIASLIIALGMLVDNAVVVSDNSKRYMEQGLERSKAVITGVEQIMSPTLMGTLTTVFAFAPLAFFLTGSRREYVFSIPAVVSITLLTSWVLGMTLTALMAYFCIRPKHARDKQQRPTLLARLLRRKHDAPNRRETSGIAAAYAWTLRRFLRVKLLVAGAAALLLVASASLPVGSEFFPDDLRDYYYIDIWLPEGSSLKRTDDVADRVEDILRETSTHTDASGQTVQRLKQFSTSVGGSGPRFALGLNPTPPASNFAQIIVQTTDPRLTNQYIEDLRREARSKIPGARVLPKKLALGPPVESPVAVRLYARGYDQPGFGSETDLRTGAQKLMDIFQDQQGLWDIDQSWGRRAYRVDVQIDENEAKLAGVTNASIAESLNAYYSGHLLTRFRDGDKQIPVFFRLPPEDRDPSQSPSVLFVEGTNGKVPLNAVAEYTLDRVSTRIQRYERNRMIEVRAKVETGFLANERLEQARPLIEKAVDDMPAGMWIEYAGTIEQSTESQGEMAFAFGLGIILIILVLIIQYNSIIKPIVVLMTVPMGFIGAQIGLWSTGNALGFMPLLGLVSLAGIVVNSAILFLEFADSTIAQRREDPEHAPKDGERAYAGLSKSAFRESLAEAGMLRLPAILLTVTTTVGGLIPLALFGGPMWEGMAYLLIFGLVIATVLTLLVLPVIYALLVELFGYNPVPYEEQD